MQYDPRLDNVETEKFVLLGAVMYRNKYSWLHNTQGPAVIWPDGQVLWALDGVKYTFDGWCDQLGIDEKRRLLLKIQYPNT